MVRFYEEYAIVIVCITCCVMGRPQSLSPTPSFCDQKGWNRVWTEEFDGGVLDTKAWTVDLGGNDSRVRDSKGTADNVYIENGALVLRSQRQALDGFQFTSGGVQTMGKKSWKGLTRICVNALLPGGTQPGAGAGIWPAHWLMPDNKACWPSNGEIDIMEMVNGDGVLHGTYHWQTNGNCGDHPTKHPSISNETKLSSDWGTSYHEYAVEYSPSHIAFVIDGMVYENTTQKSVSHDGKPAEFFDVPYYLILNTAVGGPWPKPVNESTVFPTYHRIDNIYVSQPTGN